nr:MAG: RNA-dependent RNA polymerase [brine shrimp rhabdovirus 1]
MNFDFELNEYYDQNFSVETEEEYEDEGNFESMKFLNNQDYNLNSPLLSDELDAFTLFLNTKQFSNRWNVRAQNWRIDSNYFLDFFPAGAYWKGSDELHRTWGHISLKDPDTCFFADKIINQTNEDAKITGEVLDAFLKGWINENPISHTKSIPFFCRSYLEKFVESHIIVLALNSNTTFEKDNLSKSFGMRFINDGKFFSWNTSTFGPVIGYKNFVILLNYKQVCDKNSILMMKDTWSGRFATISSLVDRLDEKFDRNDSEWIEKLYKYGDKYLVSLSNKAYSGLKLIEPICNDRLIELAHTHRPLIPKYTQFHQHVLTSLATVEDPGDHLHKIFEEVQICENVETILILYGSFRHWGHPYIDYKEGLRQLYNQVTVRKQIDGNYMEKLASDLAYKVLRDQFEKKRKWFVIFNKLQQNHPFLEHIKNNTWPTSQQIEQFGDNWHSLPLEKCFFIPDLIDPSVIYSDKSHSMTRNEIRKYLLTKNPEPIPTMKVMETVLKTQNTNWPDFLQEINNNGLSENDLVIGLQPKEREGKPAGRFFSLMGWKLREYFVITEHLIKTFFVPLFGGLTMADDLTEVIKKMLDTTGGQGGTKYDYVCIANHLDYSKWNNHQRLESTGSVFRVMGQFLGYPRLIERTHELFKKCFVYYVRRPDTMSISERGEIISNSNFPSCWNGQDGGFEGLRQKGWSVIDLLLIERESKIRNTRVGILAQGDNQVICTHYVIAKGTPEENIEDCLQKMYENNNAIMSGIKRGIERRGMILNMDETMQSADYLNYGKYPVFRGCIKGLETKRWSRITCMTNDQLPTFATVMASIATNALTVSHFEASPQQTMNNYNWFGNFGRILISLHNPALRCKVEEGIKSFSQFGNSHIFKASALYLDPSLGGISGTALSRYLSRMFPDPITESLSFWRLVYNNTRCEWVRVLSIGAGNPIISHLNTDDWSKLLEDPTALNIPSGVSTLTILKNEVKKNLYRVSDTIKNKLICSAINYSKREESRIHSFLFSIRPLFPRFISEFKSATFLGITDSLIGLFENSRTIRKVFQTKYKKEIDFMIIKNEIRSIESLGKVSFRGNGVYMWNCSSSHADKLRRQSWGQDVLGTTIPHPLELLCRPISTGGKLKSPNEIYPGYVTVSVPLGLRRCNTERGPFPAYLGSKTSESTSVIQPWEKESKIPVIKRACKLRNSISWFIKADSRLAKSILSNIKSLTGEDWSSSLDGFLRTGSALHRFSCSRVSSGGYSAQNPVKLSWMVSTTDSMGNIDSENRDFTYQSLLIYSQISVGEIHNNKSDSSVYRCYINCSECVRTIEEPWLESQWELECEDFSDLVKEWRFGREDWGLVRKVDKLFEIDWGSLSDETRSFHIGRALGFIYSDSVAMNKNFWEDTKLFPITLRDKLVPKNFLSGVVDGLIRAASLDVLSRRAIQLSSKPQSAMWGSVYYFIGQISMSVGFQTLMKEGYLYEEICSNPHRIPPSYPLSREDHGSILRSYLMSSLEKIMSEPKRQILSKPRNLLIFSDMGSAVVIGPFALSEPVVTTLLDFGKRRKEVNLLRKISNSLVSFRDDQSRLPSLGTYGRNVKTVNHEIRHAVKDIIQVPKQPKLCLKWGEEITGPVEEFRIFYSSVKTTMSGTVKVPRISDPTISGLRLAQIATGAHYKLRSIIKEKKVSVDDFLVGGDGSGGITSMLLRNFKNSRGIFNSLLDYSNTVLRGASPPPPSAVLALRGDSYRCVNLNSVWDNPSDLTQKNTWEYFLNLKRSFNLRINLMVFDMELKDTTSMEEIVELLREYVGILLENDGCVIFKTYLSTLFHDTDSPVTRLGVLFDDVLFFQTKFSSSFTSEIYLMLKGKIIGPCHRQNPDWNQLEMDLKRSFCCRTRKEEFKRALEVKGMDLWAGIPPEIKPLLQTELTLLFQKSGILGGVSVQLAFAMSNNKVPNEMLYVLMFVLSNSIIDVSTTHKQDTLPPSDSDALNLLTSIFGILIWHSLSQENENLHSYIVSQINLGSVCYWSGVRTKKGCFNKWNTNAGKVGKFVHFKSRLAAIGMWIRLLSQVKWKQPSLPIDEAKLNELMKNWNKKLKTDKMRERTGLYDLVDCKPINASEARYVPLKNGPMDGGWRS